MKLGPQLASGALDLAKAIGAETKSTSCERVPRLRAREPGRRSSPRPSSSSKLMKLQQLQEKQKEMFSMVSAIFRMQHETRSAVIGNIR